MTDPASLNGVSVPCEAGRKRKDGNYSRDETASLKDDDPSFVARCYSQLL